MPPKVVANPELLRAGLADEWADRARNRLATFVRCAWPHVETGVYVGGKHLDLLCDRLEAVNRGDTRRLLVNYPPRHSKSLLAARVLARLDVVAGCPQLAACRELGAVSLCIA